MTETPGSILKSTRESRNLHIAQVAKVTRISVRYLDALERDALDELPSPVHARGFLRTYAEFLGLDAIQLLGQTSTKPQVDPIPTGPGEVEEINPSPPEKSKKDLSVPTPIAHQMADESIEEPHPVIVVDKELPESFAKSESDQPTRESESSEIFVSIGRQLKSQRELLGISLLEVEKQSHVRMHYLQSIEAGAFDRLPSSVQARGMLSNYARFLEFDVDSLLLKFAEGLQAQRKERAFEEAGPENSRRTSSQRFKALNKYLSIDMLFGGSLILLLIVFAFWGTGKVIDLYRTPGGGGNSASISDVIMTPLGTVSTENQASAQSTAESTPSGFPQATGISSIPTGRQGQVQLYVVVLQSTYLRVIVDGQVAFDGRATPGSAYPFNGNNRVEVLTGNASALQIYFNQADLGVMGIFGEVVDRIYTPNGVLSPTATITPTITISPTPSKTPRVTATGSPSPTSTPFYLPTP